MLTANEAKQISFKNPTFERKLELYNLVSERIKVAAESGEDHVVLNDEEHAALSVELKNKGFTRFKDQNGSTGGVFVNIVMTSITTQHKYYFA